MPALKRLQRSPAVHSKAWFWNAKGRNLYEEINSIQSMVDPETWQAIHVVRQMGNIGAHMEKDVNTIIDVDPKEAQLLLGLLEHLIREWYVARYNKDESLKKIVAMAREKDAAKKGSSSYQNSIPPKYKHHNGNRGSNREKSQGTKSRISCGFRALQGILDRQGI
jgi:hypothetical protein